MLDVIVAVGGLALVGGVGAPAALLLPPRIRGRFALAPVLGYGLIAIAAPNLFSIGARVSVQLFVFVAMAALGLGLVARRLAARPPARRARRWGLAVLAVWAATVAVTSLPKWIAGSQYYAYLGNVWDHFNYTTLGTLLAKVDPDVLQRFSLDDPDAVQRNPLLPWTQLLFQRPSVMHVFAVVCYPGLAAGLSPFELANAFVTLTLSLYVFAFAFAVRSLGAPRSTGVVLLGSLFACGAWGQYLVDVNAWSQLAGVLFVLPVVTLGLRCLVDDPAGHGRSGILATWVVLTLGLAAKVYLYPEMLLAYAPIYAGTIGYRAWAGRVPVRRLGLLLAAGLTAVVLALPQARSTLLFLLRQMELSRETSNQWAPYFFGFLLGEGGWGLLESGAVTIPRLFLAAVNTLLSAVGLYHFTQPVFALRWLAAGFLALKGGFVAALLYGARDGTRGRLRWLRVALLVGLALIVVLTLTARRYGAGKAYVWLGPLVFLALVSPLLARGRPATRRLPALALLAAQLAVVALRLHGVATGDGIPFPRPYPADQHPSLKRTVDLELAPLLPEAARCQLVLVDVADRFLRHYAMVSLFGHDIAYLSKQELNTYYGIGIPLGPHRASAPPDCRLGLGAEDSAAGETARAEPRRRFGLERLKGPGTR